MQLGLYNDVLANTELQEAATAEPSLTMVAAKIAAVIVIITAVLLAKKFRSRMAI